MKLDFRSLDFNPSDSRVFPIELVAQVSEIDIYNFATLDTKKMVVLAEVGIVLDRTAAMLEASQESLLHQMLQIPVDGGAGDHGKILPDPLIDFIPGQVPVGLSQSLQNRCTLRRRFQAATPQALQPFRHGRPFLFRTHVLQSSSEGVHSASISYMIICIS